MSKTYTGRVISRRMGRESDKVCDVTVRLNTRHGPQPGDTVTVHKVLSDEEIGRKFRELFTGDFDREAIHLFLEELGQTSWPGLGDLVEDVAL